ncbi:Ribonuclease H-like domain [Pseudocohnilembus persalinus]|uniref:Ribonuclease H-like domain n=1 Tax=Pseudocohnilembus persalinus TaxID=266149 RepID=A0A0V0R6F7_PSEPJ|nr:Ribonuclease H-like domain [Pseudocohnilembus persalinus]|eukprot:KRX09930.1 Ribonuclease H-like domain [Pseudocohnilembus persalinus]
MEQNFNQGNYQEQGQGNQIFTNKQNQNGQKICKFGENCKYKFFNCRFSHPEQLDSQQSGRSNNSNQSQNNRGNTGNGRQQGYQQRRNQGQQYLQSQNNNGNTQERNYLNKQDNYGNNKFANFNKNKFQDKRNQKSENGGSLFEVKKLENGEFQVNLMNKCEFQGQCQNLLGLCKNFHQQTYILKDDEIKQVFQLVKEKELQRKQKIVEALKSKQPKNFQEVQKQFLNLWFMVDYRVWESLVDILQLKEQIEVRNINQQIMNKMRAKEIGCDEAYQFYKINKLTQQEKRDFINELIKQRKISRAKSYAVEFGFDPQKDFEHIQYQAGIGFIGYNLKEVKKENDFQQISQRIQHMETIYNSDQKQNFYYLQSLGKFFLKEQPDLVFSQFKRFEIKFKLNQVDIMELFTNQNYAQKQQQISDYQKSNYNYLENQFLENKDVFGPGEEVAGFAAQGTYFNMGIDGGINEKNVYFIYELQSEQFQYADKTLRNSQLLGFDSESCVGFESGLALIQISTEKEVFIFDIISIKKQDEVQQNKFRDLMSFLFEEESVLIVGQTIFGDMKSLKKDLGLANDIDFKGVVDISDVFFQCFSNETKHGLAFICEKFLTNKKLSKIEQCSGWHQRPLRKSQIHYASLDAYICIRLWQEAKKQFPDLDINLHIRDVKKHETIMDQKKQNRNQKQFQQIMEENKINIEGDETNEIEEE